METGRQRVEALGLAVLMFAFFILLLASLYSGAQQFRASMFYAVSFTIGMVILFIMSDKLDTNMTKIDSEVLITTAVGCIIMLFMFGNRLVMAKAVDLMPMALPQLSWFDFGSTIFFVANVESVYQYITARAVWEVSGSEKGWLIGIIVSAVGFACLHLFRYGITGAFFYVMVVGFVFLLFMRVPYMIGSDVELSIIPAVAMHAVHNLLIIGASVVLVG